jgi:type VI protein secretion system component Hcp
MKTNYFFSLLLVLVLASVTSQAQEIYLYYPGITTGKGPTGHVDEVKITSESGGMTVHSPEKNSFLPFTVTKNYDASSAGIQNATITGKYAGEAAIRFYNGSTLVLAIELKGVRVISYHQASTNECANCSTIAETMEIEFDKIRMGAFMFDRTTGTTKF